jgi:ribosomal protein S18 acetylase RimI-like enzyme
MTLQWRPVQSEQDAPFLAELFVAVRLPEFLAGGLPEPMARTVLAQQYRFQQSAYDAMHPNREHILLCRDDQPLGQLQLAVDQAELLLVDIAVLPGFQGQGIGASVLQQLQRQAAEHQQTLRLSVRRNNPARRLYTRLGFVEELCSIDTPELRLQWKSA